MCQLSSISMCLIFRKRKLKTQSGCVKKCPEGKTLTGFLTDLNSDCSVHQR